MDIQSKIFGPTHGARIAISVIDERGRLEPSSPWVSMPKDEPDLSQGFQDITYGQFANAVNHAAHWFERNLPLASEPFQPFAYSGARDLRYPILAAAAAKCQRVMVLPSSIITSEAVSRILKNKNCTTYVRDENMADFVDKLTQFQVELDILNAPSLEDLLKEDKADPVVYAKSWNDAKDDPWLVFHTSGTTGFPKPVTYTHRMMARPDAAATLDGIWETHVHRYDSSRCYTPLPALHVVGMLMLTSMSVFLRTVVVLGPVHLPPSPSIVQQVLQYGRVDGALLPPALIDSLCLGQSGLSALRSLSYIHYCGAPLGTNNGNKLSSHVQLAPSIGTTEAGGYLTKLSPTSDHWDYVSFHPAMGATFEKQLDNMHELVLNRYEKFSDIQQIFQVYPHLTQFKTNDLWVEHPIMKGMWKIVGRADDYVYLAHGEGLHASTLEPEIEKHDLVQSALIGGHGQPQPVLLIELVPSEQAQASTEAYRKILLEELRPVLGRVNARCHPSVQLSTDHVLFTGERKPFIRTAKGSVARMQSLNLYEDEIAGFFD